MTDKPILFQPDMALAAWEGRKTQTRRLLKPQPAQRYMQLAWVYQQKTVFEDTDGVAPDQVIKIPHKVGDHLWVKEHHWAYGYWTIGDGLTKAGKPKRKFVTDIPFDDSASVIFGEPKHHPVRKNSVRNHQIGWYKRNSLFMFKADSRMTLTVTDVRVQRLQDITEADAIAEGCRPFFDDENTRQVQTVGGKYIEMSPFRDSRDSFRTLINNINGPDTWAQNPWVAAYTFKVEKRNIDQAGVPA